MVKAEVKIDNSGSKGKYCSVLDQVAAHLHIVLLHYGN